MNEDDQPGRAARLAAYLNFLWTVLVFGGVFAVVFGWWAGALIMLAGVLGEITGHLVTGISEYRRLMARPWPKVGHIDDEDDDEWYRPWGLL